MGLQKVRSSKLRINAHRGDHEIELNFPENWDITECRMAGHDRPSLSDSELRLALQKPIGSPPLRELAKGAKKVCIIFDDIGRPMPGSLIMPFVLEELHAAGITDGQIRFLSAQGAHRPPTHRDLIAKLGREIVEKYPVYIHSVWENLVDMGRTSRGTPVKVNREFASCDLRIGVGTIAPIGSTLSSGPGNFGGGGKIVLPGVCGIDTIEYNHKNIHDNKLQKEYGTEGVEDINEFRLDIEEAARLAGLRFKVDVVVNNHRQVVGLFAGDFVAEHRAGVKLAAEVCRTETIKNADVVVINSYPNELHTTKVMWCIVSSLRQGGDAVILTHTSDGQMLHQLRGRWGTDYGARLYVPSKVPKKQEKAARVMIVAPELSRFDRDNFGLPEKVIHCRDWSEALGKLVSSHGSGTRVGVYPCATVQMPDEAGL